MWLIQNRYLPYEMAMSSQKRSWSVTLGDPETAFTNRNNQNFLVDRQKLSTPHVAQCSTEQWAPFISYLMKQVESVCTRLMDDTDPVLMGLEREKAKKTRKRKQVRK